MGLAMWSFSCNSKGDFYSKRLVRNEDAHEEGVSSAPDNHSAFVSFASSGSRSSPLLGTVSDRNLISRRPIPMRSEQRFSVPGSTLGVKNVPRWLNNP